MNILWLKTLSLKPESGLKFSGCMGTARHLEFALPVLGLGGN